MDAFLLGAGCTFGTLCNQSTYPPLAKDFGRCLIPGNYPNLSKVARHLRCELSQLGLERLWSCVDYYAKFAQRRGGFLPNPDWSHDDTVCELKRAVLSLYGRRCDEAAKGVRRSINCTLAHLLRNRIRPGDTIISLNYDTLVENLARRFGLRLAHCSGPPPKNRVRFAKPHGSTSWCIGRLDLNALSGLRCSNRFRRQM